MSADKRYEGQSVLILGLGVSGKAAAQFLLKRGAQVTGVDQQVELMRQHPEIQELQDLGLSPMSESQVSPSAFNLVVASPGISPTHPLYRAAQEEQIELIGEAELAFRSLRVPCLAVTGSNGKTSTVLLTAHVLNQSGIAAKALGNVGRPLTKGLDELNGEVVIVELSSWQLETLSSRVVDAAVILNMTPNHLDRHGNMETYVSAKLNLIRCLKPGRSLYMGMSANKEFAHLIHPFQPITFGYELDAMVHCDQEFIRLKENIEFQIPPVYRGKISHEIENMMASYVLCREVGIAPQQFLNAFATFQKPPHRIEFVRVVCGVSYYDDSKASSVDAVIKAVLSLKGSIFLIAGGVHKGASYVPWIKAFEGRVCAVCAIGQAASLIQAEIGADVPVVSFSTLEEAVNFAAAHASPGDHVLLSPGCASFDMFCDYKHRGKEFKRLVCGLED